MPATTTTKTTRPVLTATRSVARGRWREILSATLGIPGEQLNSRHHACPKCGGTDRFRAYDDVDETGGVICSQCHATENKSGFDTVMWFLECDFKEALRVVAEHIGPAAFDMPAITTGKSAKPKPKIVATYDYHDSSGKVAHQTVRYDPKEFKQRRPKESSDGWVWSLKGSETVLYHLPEIIASNNIVPIPPIVIVEGEKDADSVVASLSHYATTCPMGAGKWKDSYTLTLKGRDVIIVGDVDKPRSDGKPTTGRQHVVAVANALHGVANSVRVVELPNPPTTTSPQLVPKWDISDWISTGGNREVFDAVVAATLAWNPAEHVDELPAKSNESVSDPHRLARLFISENIANELPTIRLWRGAWYRWHDGYYDSLDQEEIRCRVVDCMKREFDRINIEQLKKWKPDPEKEYDKPPQTIPVTVASVGSVMQALRSLCVLPAVIESPSLLVDDGTTLPAKHLVSLANGVLNLNDFLADADDVLTPHSPSLFTLAALSITFDPIADCPLWRAFLARNLANDDRCDMLQEWFGLCTTFNNSFQSFLMMEGVGSNGKSVICSALTALLSPRNVSHVPLECFGETFHLSGTVGKLANIVSEIGEVEKANEGTLKSYTSGDRMTFNRKNLPLFEAVPTARLVMATNTLPRFADRSNGVWRRMLLLPLTVVIDASEKVAGMDSAEWWSARPSELSGMFLWALTGFARLMRPPGKFTEPVSSSAAKEEYKKDCFIARRFLDETYEADPNGEVSTLEMYKLYQKWCDDHGNKPQACNSFAKEIKHIFPEAAIKRWVIRHDGTKGPGYVGFEIREQPSLEQQHEENKKSASLF